MKKILLFCAGISAATYYGRAQSPTPGSTDGVFNVSDLGAATYSIPIKVPAGTGGLQPTLSLSYNSMGGNDIMGVGWTLSGTSAITRVPENIYNDKNNAGISLTATDKFALDGNRLILTAGTYGAASSQYNTEYESFKTLTAEGTMGSGPAGFIATDLSGTTYEYPSTAAGQVVLPGTSVVYEWMMDKVIDIKGNYMTYEYTQIGNGEVLLSAIKYGGNQNTGTPYQSEVSFTYVTRSDPGFRYVGGSSIHQSMKLGKITVTQNDAGTWKTARVYTLGYTDDFYTHLSTVSEAGAGNVNTLPATQFAYGATATMTSDIHSEFQSNIANTLFAPGDYNGDGKTDVVKFTAPLSGNSFTLYLSQGNSGSFTQAQTGTLSYDPAFSYGNTISPSHQAHGMPFDYNGDGMDDFIFVQNDYYAPCNCSTVHTGFGLYLSTGTSLTPTNRIVPAASATTQLSTNFGNVIPLAGDFDGDGKSEILAVTAATSPAYSYLIGDRYNTATMNLGTSPTPYPALLAYGFSPSTNPLPFSGANGAQLFAIDYNGDGKTDVMQLTGSGTYVYEMNVTFDANNNPVIGSPAFKLINSASYPSTLHNVLIGDFNGDRISDVLTWISGTGWQIGYGNGMGLMNNVPTTGTPPMAQPLDNSSNLRPVYVGDFNGDGKDDIYDYNPSSTWGQPYAPKIFYSKGNNVFVQESPALDQSVIADYNDFTWLGDYNGDGAADMLTRHTPASSTPYIITLHPNETRHMISQVRNGLNAVTKVNYLPLSSGNVYTPGSAVSYPFVQKVIPVKVVSAVNTDNGINTNGNDVSYTYSGFKYNVWGKGLMGFDWVKSHDVLSNTDYTKNFGLNTAYAFPYLQSQMTSQTGPVTIFNPYPQTILLQSEYNTPGVYHYGNNRVFTYTTQTDNHNYVDNTYSTTTYNYTTPPVPPFVAPFGTVFSTTIGKPMSVTVNKGSGLETTLTSYTFPPSQTLTAGPNNTFQLTSNPPYVYSQPASVTVTNTRQGQAAYTRKTSFTYGSNALPATTITDPGTSNAVTTTLAYDAYGNVTQKAISSPGLTGSTEAYVYDASNRYMIKSYNTTYPNMASVTTFDAISGNPLEIDAADQLITTSVYDGFGRLTSRSDNSGGAYNLGAAATINYNNASGNPYAPSGAQYVVVTSPNTAMPSYQFYDRLNRLTRTARPGFDGTMIYEDVNYNMLGQVASRSKPYFQSGSPVNILYYYDGFGRQTTEVRPEGANSLSYVISGGNLVTTATDPGGKQKITATDASGRTVSVTDNNGSTLSYTYHSNGHPTQVTMSGAGIISNITYDAYGHKIQQTDPNYAGPTGSFQYTYNAYGQMLSQQDPHGNIYNLMTYDVMGNLTSKTGQDGVYNYYFNYTVAPNMNAGKMMKMTGPGVEHDYYYGMGDRVTISELTTNAGGQTHMFRTDYSYDNKGRLASVTYPNHTAVVNTYNTNDGSLMAKGRAGDMVASPFPGGQPVQAQLYSIIDKNALGQTLHAGIQSSSYLGAPFPFFGFVSGTTQNYDAYDHLVEQSTINVGTQAVPGFDYRDVKYSFDPATGDLQSRADLERNLQESFSYDNLDRLYDIQGPSPVHINYFPNGNIKTKTDAGDFGYDQGNKVSEINSYVNIPETEQDVDYTPFHKVASVMEGDYAAKFTYWADGSRASMALYKGGVLMKTKFYINGFEREEDAVSGSVRELCYVNGPEGNLVAILENTDGNDRKYFVLTDHLGSITHIIDEGGTLVEEKSFDAWGRARDPQTWAALLPTNESNNWDRGYTGHELIPVFGIINMNGRLYDPLLGRVFSPDDHAQQPDNTQSYNRYSYCLNNPLKYKDPNGEWFGLDDAIVAAAGFVVGYIEYAAASGHLFSWKAAANGLGSAAMAWLGYNTFGMSAIAAGTGYGSTAEFASTYAIASGANFVEHGSEIRAADSKGWNGVLLGAGYNAIAAVDAGLTEYQNYYSFMHAGTELSTMGTIGFSAANGAFDQLGGAILKDGYNAETNSWRALGDISFWEKTGLHTLQGAAMSLSGDWASGDLNSGSWTTNLHPSMTAYIMKHMMNTAVSNHVQDFTDNLINGECIGLRNFFPAFQRDNIGDVLPSGNDGYWDFMDAVHPN